MQPEKNTQGFSSFNSHYLEDGLGHCQHECTTDKLTQGEEKLMDFLHMGFLSRVPQTLGFGISYKSGIGKCSNRFLSAMWSLYSSS